MTEFSFDDDGFIGVTVTPSALIDGSREPIRKVIDVREAWQRWADYNDADDQSGAGPNYKKPQADYFKGYTDTVMPALGFPPCSQKFAIWFCADPRAV